MSKTIIGCCRPFRQLEIYSSGAVIPCCWAKSTAIYSIGNIFTMNFDEIWHGEKAQELRRSIVDGSYRYCKRGECDCDNRAIDESWIEHPPLPESVKLSFIRECQCACTICRDDKIVKSENNNINDILKNILSLAQKAKYVEIAGDGDPLFSSHYRTVIRNIAQQNQDTKFNIFTNGLLLTGNLLNRLGIVNRIDNISISIHSATAKTYEKIVLGGDWEKLQRRLKYAAGLKEKGSIRGLYFNFVVCPENIGDIVPMADMARANNAVAVYWFYYHWRGNKNFPQRHPILIQDPRHPLHKDMIKAFREIIDSPYIMVRPEIRALVEKEA